MSATKFSTGVRRKSADIRTRIAGAVTAAIDLCCFRTSLKRKLAASLIAEERIFGLVKDREHQIEELKKEVEAEKREVEAMRVQLGQLRVVPEKVEDRTGFMVSVFVPSAALNRLRGSTESEKQAFRDRVASELVRRALDGLYRVTKNGKLVAVVFAPLGSANPVITPMFETDNKIVARPLLAKPPAPANDLSVRLIQTAEYEQRQREVRRALAIEPEEDSESDKA